MQNIIIFLCSLLLVACSTPQPLSTKNANANIVWASGRNEKLYIPDSKETLAFIATNNVVIYKKTDNPINNSCHYYDKDKARIKICDDGEVILFIEGEMINTGFIHLHNNY